MRLSVSIPVFKFIFSICRHGVLALAFFLLTSEATAAAKVQNYYLIGGPAIVSGHRRGLGALAGLINLPPSDEGFSHGFVGGAFIRGKSVVVHSDFIVGVSFRRFVNFFIGPGLRLGESRPPYLQLSYGVGVGAGTFALRNYFGPSGLQTEGVIMFTIPFHRFSDS